MKLNYTKLAFTSFILITSVFVYAQKEFQGKAYYQSKTSLDMSNFGRPGMSEDQKNQMAARMKSVLEKTFILTFNQLESIYKEEEKLEAPGFGGGGRFSMMNSFIGGPLYKNVKSQMLLQDQDFFGKQFLIKDTLTKYNWELGGETKLIGKYLCFKATATTQSTTFDFTSFGRPTDKEQNSKVQEGYAKTKDEVEIPDTPEEIKVEAWYTLQIPVNHGPGEYWGLPGLILEVNSDKTTILCSKIVMNPEDKSPINPPSKGKEVSKVAYDVIVKKKTAEMIESYRAGREGGPAGGRRGN